MLNKLKVLALSLIIIFSFNKEIFAEDIPVIVISPGKSIQSLNTVGSSVEVISSDKINNSSHFSLGNVIDDNSTSTNLFQMGGYGSNIGIQLRGLEKRYSTVYVDGVKMLDPSSADGSFYLENIMKNGIDRVEILKGTQSSLYGSNAIGGTINIFTKKGREGNHSNFEIETAEDDTRNLSYSIDGSDSKFDYYLGLNKFITDGISAMNDNNEKDQYRNDNIVANFGYKINENFEIRNSSRIADTFYEYDTVNKTRDDSYDSTDNLELSNSLKLIHKKNKFKNTISYNKLHIKRATTDYLKAKVNYFGYRDALNYLGEYNFNLDNKIVYGIDSEFDASRYPQSFSGGDMKRHDEGIISQYFDLQLRPSEKLYSTFGLRSDDHTTVGRKTSGRVTAAYLLDGNSKIRSSFGAGVRFPAMYDYSYAFSNIVSKGGSLDELQSERGLSFDLGYDTFIDKLDLGLNLTYFKTEQKNSLLSNARTLWVIQNADGRNTSEGIELGANWKPAESKFAVNLGYTFTDSYDANTCSETELAAWADNECRLEGKLADAKVRVPRHAIQTNVSYSINQSLKSFLTGKYIGETRDFGNTNDSWTDQILTDYFVFDLINSYNLPNNYKLHFGINNILDEKYQQAHEYSAPGRSINFGIKRVY